MSINRLIDSGQPIQPPPDVQTTTLSLDVLGRYCCSTWDEATDAGNRLFDAVVIGAGMFGGYCGEQIYRMGAANNLKVLVLDAGPFVIPTHVQNLPKIGLNVPGPMYPANDPGRARELVWGMPWRSNVDFVGQAYCVGGKSIYWGGWCPRLEADDLTSWPASVVQYLTTNYPLLERQTGVDPATDFIQGPLFNILRARLNALVPVNAIANLSAVEDPPLAVQGESPASGIFSFDKFSSVALLLDAVREAAGQPDYQRRLFVVPNAHVVRLNTSSGFVNSVEVSVNGQLKTLPIKTSCPVILAAGMVESTRMAMASFPTTSNASQELMGRNFMGHVRSNLFARVKRTAIDPGNTLPAILQTGALLLRGRAPQGKFHIQLTASADVGFNSDGMLYTMIPDIDQFDATLNNQQSGWISLGLRGVSETFGDKNSSVPNAAGRWINLSPFESDEFGVPRAYVQFTTTPVEDALATAMDTAMIEVVRQLAGNNPANFQITSQNRDGLGTTYHEAGTLWVGTDPLTSVTDTNGRFHHVANAYCADQSLFVTGGSVNPVLTGLVLSRKVAQAAVAQATGALPPP